MAFIPIYILILLITILIDYTAGIYIEKTEGRKKRMLLLMSIVSTCLVLFIFLFAMWNKHKLNLPEGRIFGWFLVILWTLRFLYEFLKENQVSFEDKMPINMGQLLSIPLVIISIVILVRSYRQTGTPT